MLIQVSKESWGAILAEAKRETWSEQDDFSAMDYSGGNFDDAYWGGVADGRAELAASLVLRATIVEED